MSYRYTEDERLSVTATAPEFYADVSGSIAHGVIFVPGCIADVGTKVKLRITLPNGDKVKAEGRVKWTRKHGIPGCAVSWHATGASSVASVKTWQASQRKAS